MTGKVIISVEELSEDYFCVDVDTDLDDCIPEETTVLVHSLARALELTKEPVYAGALAVSMLCDLPAHEVADTIGTDQFVTLCTELCTEMRQLINEYSKHPTEGGIMGTLSN